MLRNATVHSRCEKKGPLGDSEVTSHSDVANHLFVLGGEFDEDV